MNNLTEFSQPIDEVLYRYVTQEPLQSFQLFAGAGSGKTRTLTNLLEKLKEQYINRLITRGQKITVITYTNAACEEIKRRVNYDDNFFVSTIHSFAWNMIAPHTQDIREVIKIELQEKLGKLKEEQNKSKNTTSKAYLKRIDDIYKINKRLDKIDAIKAFKYSPDTSKQDNGNLQHSEVINLFGKFIETKALFGSILIKKHPILFIDEAQDTYEKVLTPLINLQQANAEQFVIGLFGDPMQRIYSNNNMDIKLPSTWKSPIKIENYRCPIRVVNLLNNIRSDSDKLVQDPKKKEQGYIRCFILDTNKPLNKLKKESEIKIRMAEITGDDLWLENNIKTLILEHSMAANRCGFGGFYFPLYNSSLKDDVNAGDTTEFNFLKGAFTQLVRAIQKNSEFEVIKLIRENSTYLKQTKSLAKLKEISQAKDELQIKILSSNTVTIGELLRFIDTHNLMDIPDKLKVVLKRDLQDEEENLTPEDLQIVAWQKAFNASVQEVLNYSDYINDVSAFGTHQGVKGLEFPRVALIIDDEDTGGFLFKYEKLFGTEELSERDLSNEREGKDTAISRARRLFYVTCSRAEKSLAIICYTKQQSLLIKKLESKGWLEPDEMVLINS